MLYSKSAQYAIQALICIATKEFDKPLIISDVEIIDGPMATSEMCVVGLDVCDDEAICPFHADWMKIYEDIQILLQGENLEHLAEKVIEKRRQLRQRADLNSSQSSSHIRKE